MNQQLQDAIKEVAVYDGWAQKEAEDLSWWWRDYHFRESIEAFGYHTSTDSLLPVWRKVRDEVNNIKGKNGPLFYVFNDAMYQVVMDILNNNLPEAVIKLAGIIQQLKQK